MPPYLISTASIHINPSASFVVLTRRLPAAPHASDSRDWRVCSFERGTQHTSQKEQTQGHGLRVTLFSEVWARGVRYVRGGAEHPTPGKEVCASMVAAMDDGVDSHSRG